MLPDWMKTTDHYVPPKDGGTFAVRTMQTIGSAMARIKIQKGHEKGRAMPALLKLALLLAGILLVSAVRNRLIVMAVAAAVLLYLCTWPARDLWGILKPALGAGALALLLFLPAMLLHSGGRANQLFVVAKVILCVVMLNIFNHTTQWNHITAALRRIRIPGIFVFLLDITLKYIVLLGNLICDLLTSLRFRSVGKNDRKYTSIGGVMGVTFVRGAEMNQQMYEAMRCRGFTDDYEGL